MWEGLRKLWPSCGGNDVLKGASSSPPSPLGRRDRHGSWPLGKALEPASELKNCVDKPPGWRCIRGVSALYHRSHLAASTVGWKPHSLPGKNQHLPVSSSVPSEIFPYLVVVIGLENVLVLTKSVVSTPVDLEVKLRIAQGNIGVMGYSFISMPKGIRSPQNSFYGCGDGKVLAAQV